MLCISALDCFVAYEERTDTWTGEDGTEHAETYTVAVPIASLDTIYANICSESITEPITPNLVTALYNVVDTYFVSGLGTQQVGAVSVAFPISLIFSGIRGSA